MRPPSSSLVWVLVPAASEVPGVIARQVRSSAVAEAVANIGPPPPDTVRALRNLVASSRFPEVFADLQPTPATGPPPEEIAVDGDIVDAATASTVNVETEGCGRRFEGSGFAAESDTIVTNAHVVAGADTVQVRRPDGSLRPATVVVFDPDRDLAVLAVDDLGQEPLGRAQAAIGDVGVVIGYPGGQDTPRVAPAEVRDQRTAIGRDIYGQDRTEREVLFLASDLAQGDSGSPVIDTEGRVTGVVFAISPDQAASSFALDLPELEEVLALPREVDQHRPLHLTDGPRRADPGPRRADRPLPLLERMRRERGRPGTAGGHDPARWTDPAPGWGACARHPRPAGVGPPRGRSGAVHLAGTDGLPGPGSNASPPRCSSRPTSHRPSGTSRSATHEDASAWWTPCGPSTRWSQSWRMTGRRRWSASAWSRPRRSGPPGPGGPVSRPCAGRTRGGRA